MIFKKEYPSDWNTVTLQDVISSCQSGIWGNEATPDEHSYPIIRSTEITHDGKIDLSTVSYRKVPNDKIEKYRLENGDILIVGSSGSSHLIGRSALFKHPNDDQIYLFSNFMIRIRPKNVYPEYLYYFLNSYKYYNFLKSLQQTSTGLRNLPKREFLQLKIPLPPLPEQKAIAKILSTVDKAIQKVDEAIAKTERLKKGLMQKLLTEGIGHKEYKYSKELGCEIPKEWKVVMLEEITSIKGRIGWHGLRDEDYLTKGEFYLVRGIDFENGKIVWNKCLYIPKEWYDKDPNIQLKLGDILATKDGSIGKIALVDYLPKKATLGTGVFRIRTETNECIPRYLYYIFDSFYFKRFIQILKAGSTLSHLYQKDLVRFKIPLPPLPEQQKIAEILSTVDKKLELERKRKEKLERIKKGLMNDLLTGRKRVKIGTET